MSTALLEKTTALVKAVDSAVRLKLRMQRRQYVRAAFEQLHLKKVEKIEADLQRSLEPFFEVQIKSVEKKLRKLARQRKTFCPTGPGGGVDPTCSPSQSGGLKIISAHDDLAGAINKLGFVNADADAVARMAGALPGSTVTITVSHDNQGIGVNIKHPDYRAHRNISLDLDGKLIIENNIFYAKKTGSGLGTRVFSQQVALASSFGVSAIHTHASGRYLSKNNGYYTWPRLGYDGPIPRVDLKPHARAELKKQFPKAKKISDLMKSEAGREFWKSNGRSASLKFDLREGSQSRKVLDAYVAAKAKERAGSGKSAGAEFSGRRAAGRDLGQPAEEYVWSGEASTLAKRVFSPSDWDDELVDCALPPLAKAMAEEMVRSLKELGLDVRRRGRKKAFCPTGPGGGVDPSCGSGGGGGLSAGEKQQAKDRLASIPDQDDDPGTISSHAVFPKRTGKMFILADPKKKQQISTEVLLSDLTPTQYHIPRKGLGAYIDSMPDETPLVVRVEGNMYIQAGHTRLGAQALAGRTTAKVRFAEYIPRSGSDKGRYVDKPDPPQKSFTGSKASTASEWLEDWNISIDDVVFDTPGGNITMGFVTEYPAWMKQEIRERLKETFEQDYWAGVNETTFGDIEGYLKKGLKDGWSIQKMADEIIPQLMNQGHYAEWRAKTIARTESGHALNSARVASADQLIESIPELPMKKVWLSVLGTTTRREHADLDGVPANKDGLWRLGGVWVRWPGDINLPPENRINCQCSILVQFGLSDATAEELIQEYGYRLTDDYEEPDEEKAFCATGRGGGVDPSCGSGGDASQQWAKKLDKSQKEVARKWFDRVNLDSIRNDQADGTKNKAVADFEKLVESAPAFQGTIYRGLEFGQAGFANDWGLKPGKTVMIEAHSSCSKDSQIADAFATLNDFGNPKCHIVLEIKSKTGGDISAAAPRQYRNQEEVVLKKGTQLKIQSTRIETVKDNYGDKRRVTYLSCVEL